MEWQEDPTILPALSLPSFALPTLPPHHSHLDRVHPDDNREKDLTPTCTQQPSDKNNQISRPARRDPSQCGKARRFNLSHTCAGNPNRLKDNQFTESDGIPPQTSGNGRTAYRTNTS